MPPRVAVSVTDFTPGITLWNLMDQEQAAIVRGHTEIRYGVKSWHCKQSVAILFQAAT